MNVGDSATTITLAVQQWCSIENR